MSGRRRSCGTTTVSVGTESLSQHRLGGSAPLFLLFRRERRRLDWAASRTTVFMPIHEHAEVAPEIDQRGALIGQLEPNSLHIASVLAATVDVLVDHDLCDGCQLVPRRRRKV